MRAFFTGIFWTVFAVSFAGVAAARPLKVLTFNAYLLCVGPKCLLADSPDLNARAEKIGDWIKRLKPDVVLLQEVWQPEQFEIVAKRAGLPHHFYPGRPSEMALLSRYPLEHPEFREVAWQAGPYLHSKIVFVGYRAGLMTAELRFENGQRVTIANTHAQPRDSGITGFLEPRDAATPERQLGLLQMMSELKPADPNQPIVFGGDFNMNQGSDEYRFFMESGIWHDALRSSIGESAWQSACSYCEDNPFLRQQKASGERLLDHVFGSRGNTRVLRAEVLRDGPALSDHFGVWSELEVNAAPRMTLPAHFPTRDELARIEAHVRDAAIHPLCYFRKVGWTQRPDALKWIAHFREGY